MENKKKKILFAETSEGEIKKLVDNFAQRKIHKIRRNDLSAFGLGYCSERYIILNKSLSLNFAAWYIGG